MTRSQGGFDPTPLPGPTMIRATLLLATIVAIAACGLEATGPQLTTDGLPAGLEALLTVAPNEVAQHVPFDVTFTVTNTSSQTVQIVSAHGCLVIPGVYRNGERVPFRGSWWGCTAAITTHTFEPGETRTHTWEMRAERYAEHPGDVDGVPVARGTYRVQAEFDTFVDASGRKPGVEATLRVR
jgi:hypothetical protein